MPPEKSAYALARYSRSPDSIRDSIEWVRAHDSQKFLESFYFQYGHASIADLGPHRAVLRRHLGTGRHRDRRGAAVGRPGEIVALPGFFALRIHHAAGTSGGRRGHVPAAPAKRCWRPTPRSTSRPSSVCAERLPRPADMKPDAYQRNIAARAFDVARYLLFWGVPTNVGQVTSIRTLEKQIRRLKASEYAGTARAGRRDRPGLRRRAGLPLGPERRRRSRSRPRWRAMPSPTSTPRAARRTSRSGRSRTCRAGAAEPAPERVDLLQPADVPADIAATLLYPVTDRPFRELYEWRAAGAPRGAPK